MNAVRMLMPTLVAAALACACAGTKEPQSITAAPPHTTAAATAATAVTMTTTSADVGKSTGCVSPSAVERPAAEIEEARAQRAADASARREHDALEIHVLDALEKADREIDVLREQSKAGTYKRWMAVERALRSTQPYRANVLVDLRRLHGDLAMMSWEVFKKSVDANLEDLDASIDRARETWTAMR